MKYAGDAQYMSIIATVADVDNAFLSRRELVCDFAGLGGRLKKAEAVEMITKEFKLDGKTVIPMRLKTHVGKPLVTGTFYVYDDEALAKKHVDPTVFARIEKANAADAEAAGDAEAGDKPAESGDAKAAEPADNAEAGDKPAESSDAGDAK